MEHPLTTPHLFPPSRTKKSNSKWDTDRLSSLLNDTFQIHMGMSMNVRNYRQCAKGITKELVQRTVKERDIFAKQAAHSAATAEQHYGLNSEELPDCPSRAMWEFLMVSLHWHRFLGLVVEANEQLESQSSTECYSTSKAISEEPPSGISSTIRKLMHDSPNDDQDPLASNCKRPKLTTIRMDFMKPLNTICHHEDMITALRALHGTNARFRSSEQSLAVSRVSAGDSPLLVVLPTGGGKTDVWLLPALCQSARITIVVSPLTALTNDIIRRAKASGVSNVLNFHEITEAKLRAGSPGFTSGIIVVTTETAIENRFFTFLGITMPFPASFFPYIYANSSY